MVYASHCKCLKSNFMGFNFVSLFCRLLLTDDNSRCQKQIFSCLGGICMELSSDKPNLLFEEIFKIMIIFISTHYVQEKNWLNTMIIKYSKKYVYGWWYGFKQIRQQ